MIFQTVNRTDAEKVWVAFKNVSGGTISGNYPVCLTTTSGSADGHQAVSPATANVLTLIGIAEIDYANTQDGCIAQCYGYRDSVRIFATASSGTIGAGVAMGPAAGSNGVNSSGLKDVYGPIISMEAIGAATTSAGGYAKAFIRTL